MVMNVLTVLLFSALFSSFINIKKGNCYQQDKSVKINIKAFVCVSVSVCVCIKKTVWKIDQFEKDCFFFSSFFVLFV